MKEQLCIYIYYIINHKHTAFTQINNVSFTSAAVCGVSEGGGGGAVAWAEVEAALPDGAGAGVDTVTSSRPGIDANCIRQTKNISHQTRQQGQFARMNSLKCQLCMYYNMMCVQWLLLHLS